MEVKIRLSALFLVGFVCVLVGAGAALAAGYLAPGGYRDTAQRLAAAESDRRAFADSYERLAGRLGDIAIGAGTALQRAEGLASPSQRLRERLGIYEGVVRDLLAIADELDKGSGTPPEVE